MVPQGRARVTWAGKGSSADPSSKIYGNPVDKPTIFLAGYAPTGGTSVTKFYVGIHVPYDRGLDNNDKLTLYFDATGNQVLDKGDFALVYDVGQLQLVDKGEACNIAPGLTRIYLFDGSWKPGTSPPPGISTSVAYDMEATSTDLVSGVWELEVAIDAGTTLGTPGTSPFLSSAKFRIGAKLIPHDFNTSDLHQIWIWPAGLTTDMAPLHWGPGYGDVRFDQASSLSEVTFTKCADVTIRTISATGAAGGNNTFTRPKLGDWVGTSLTSSTLPLNKQNKFTAEVHFGNPSDPGEVTTIPNTGKVQFLIRAWGGGKVENEQVMASETMSFDRLNQTKTISIGWPQTYVQYEPIETDMVVNSDHACLEVRLDGFLVNVDPASDVQYRNLTYTPALNPHRHIPRDHAKPRAPDQG